ncbi:hypothetical protein JOQ06_013706, partial [Pogonophryne albipinna]
MFELLDEEGRGADYIPSYGESLFHVLTCLERYLAVVRPIIYLRLRNVQGVRIRNISIGLSVLCVLIRPGPGNGERVDQSKQSAFYTVTAITAALWLLGPRITKALCGVPLFTPHEIGRMVKGKKCKNLALWQRM